MESATRRMLLTRAAAAGAAGAVICQVANAQAEPKRARRIIGGSPYPTFSRAVAFDGLVYASGVVGQKPGSRELVSPDFGPQCRQALQNLKASVEASGATMAKVLKCTCFLTDAADFAEFNRVYTGFFPAEPPARSTVVVKELVVGGAKLEIDCVACLE